MFIGVYAMYMYFTLLVYMNARYLQVCVSLCVCMDICMYICMYVCIYTGWNDKIVVLKKTTLQLYITTFIEKINSSNLIL